MSLTEAGERLRTRVEPAMRDIEVALDELGDFRGTPMGRLRLNAAGTSARLVLMPLVARFLKAHPSVRVEIAAQNALVDMVSGGFDAGVRFGETIAADMIAMPLGRGSDPRSLPSPAFLHRWPRPLTPHDLSRLPCIRYRFENGSDYRWEFERGGAELRIAVDGPFGTNEQDLMVQAALEDIGLAYVFEGVAEPLVAEGRLVRVLEDWCPYYPGFFLYYPSRRQPPTALRAFVDFVRAHH